MHPKYNTDPSELQDSFPERLTKEYILQHREPWFAMTGIYFLIDDGEIVYVGQARNDIAARLIAHHRSGKIFDSYFWTKCHPDYLSELEADYIVRFEPRYNMVIPLNYRWMTITRLLRHMKGCGIESNKLSEFIRERKIKPVGKYYHVSDFDDLVLESWSS